MAKNVPAKQAASQLPAAILEEMEANANAGFETTTPDDFSIPFITILQKMSPQCDKVEDAYIEGAEPGMFFDTSTGQIMKDENGEPLKEITVVPVHYLRQFIRWKERDAGGGFVSAHTPDDEIISQGVRNEAGKLVLDGGDYLSDTRQFYVMVVDTVANTGRPAIISMASTQIKKARTWLTRMQDFKIDGANGKFTPPMYGQMWVLGTMGEKNSKGSWHGWALGEPELVGDAQVYQAGKTFRDSILSGTLQAATPAASSSVGDDPPFDGADQGADEKGASF
jgi:hypothetical protein